MVCFSIFMAYVLQDSDKTKTLLLLFGFQWILNVSWNPIFFYFRRTGIGLIVITLLLLLVIFALYYYT